MEKKLLESVELRSERDRPDAVVIWLHGLGASGHDFPPIVPHLGIDPELAIDFVFPHADAIPVTINGGMVMPAWYDILSMDLKRRHDEAGVRKSAQQVRDLIEHEIARGMKPEQILLAGFSQGGAIALHLGLRYEHKLAGILALSTYLVCEESLAAEIHEANRQTPIFQAHGMMDPMVSFERGEAAKDRLLELDYQVDFRSYPMVHEVTLQEAKDIGAFIESRLKA